MTSPSHFRGTSLRASTHVSAENLFTGHCASREFAAWNAYPLPVNLRLKRQTTQEDPCAPDASHLFAAAVLAVPLAPATGSLAAQPAAAASPKPLVVTVLSNRADLVSGGDALVAVDLPAPAGPRRGDGLGRGQGRHRPVPGAAQRAVRRAAHRPRRRRQHGPGHRARVRRLARWSPTTRTAARSSPVPSSARTSARTTALDAQCNEPASYSLLYKSTRPDASPGCSPTTRTTRRRTSATTTTDEGVEVPFIVRQREGLPGPRPLHDPDALPARAGRGSPGSRRSSGTTRCSITHGGGCGASYAPGDPPLDDYSGTIPSASRASSRATSPRSDAASRSLSTALDNTGHNCNLAMQAESMMMAKERLVEQYGRSATRSAPAAPAARSPSTRSPTPTPGIYQGLVTTCSYPDMLTAGAQFADYHLLRLYFEDPSRWGRASLWRRRRWPRSRGTPRHVNAVTADEGLFKERHQPGERRAPAPRTRSPATRRPATTRETNPGGVRCSVLDIMVNLLGPRPRVGVDARRSRRRATASPGMPFANPACSTASTRCSQGPITAAQFVDLNAKVGGLDIDADPVAGPHPGRPGRRSRTSTAPAWSTRPTTSTRSR